MKIDTLILAGSSSKGSGYIGSLWALYEYNLVNMKNIKNIIGCSSGSLLGFMLLLDFNNTMIYKLLKNIDLINLNNFNLNEMFINNGIFNNNNIKVFLKTCLKYKYNINDITFIELYKKTKIKFIIKVYNLSLHKNEYLSYKNNPTMSVITAMQISTCIPIIFKPIKYNNYYYVDGGISNNIPFLKNKKYKNYLLLYVTTIENNLKNTNYIDYENIDYIDYITQLFNINILEYKKDNKRNIRLIINLDIIQFSIKNILNDIILDCYNQTIKHIKKYNL
tara:strand:- start:654 stop:1487 length:834 start_codon:yes stop_codon:yes gene_type:complete